MTCRNCKRYATQGKPRRCHNTVHDCPNRTSYVCNDCAAEDSGECPSCGSTNEQTVVQPTDGAYTCPHCANVIPPENQTHTQYCAAVLVQCPNSTHGCPVFTQQEHITDHVEHSCKYGPMPAASPSHRHHNRHTHGK